MYFSVGLGLRCLVQKDMQREEGGKFFVVGAPSSKMSRLMKRKAQKCLYYL